ncbi:MAG: hypothetical protein NXH72_06160 [Hyphomonadaceae bacterium]|nr:hypothetical protein [Hyphomonadaceae bacterium]
MPFDAEEADRVADWLEIVRANLTADDALSNETQSELQQALALAEAALRRASVEATVSDAILGFFRPN